MRCASELRLTLHPYFVGVLDSILRGTFKRYPGAGSQRREIPCPCGPGCNYSHPRDIVLKRKRDAKPDITCPVSGKMFQSEHCWKALSQPTRRLPFWRPWQI